jgi:hypothetical protein
LGELSLGAKIQAISRMAKATNAAMTIRVVPFGL